MSQDLIDRLNNNRKFSETVGTVTFECLCPPYSQVSAIITNSIVRETEDLSDAKIAAKTVIGWSGMTEADIVPDGDRGKLVPYDAQLFQAIIYDRSDWWVPISKRVTEMVQERKKLREAELKNLTAGTTTKPLNVSIREEKQSS